MLGRITVCAGSGDMPVYVETGGRAKAGMVRGSDAKECKKNPPTLSVDFHVLVGRGRLERPTNGLKVRCYTN